MSRKDPSQDVRGISLSAIYRQLDGLPSPEARHYDPAAAVARMMTRWADEGLIVPGAGSPPTEASRDRREFIVHLARRRMLAAFAAIAAIVVIGGTAATAAAVLARHATPLVLAGVGATAVLLALAVVAIHWITMNATLADHVRLLDTGARPQQEAPGPAVPVLDEELDDDRGHARPRASAFRRAGFLLPVAVLALGVAGLYGNNRSAITNLTIGVIGAATIMTIMAVITSQARTDRLATLIRALRAGSPRRDTGSRQPLKRFAPGTYAPSGLNPATTRRSFAGIPAESPWGRSSRRGTPDVCPNCGEQLESGDAFCGSCGTGV